LPRATAFDLHWRQYDAWYDKQEAVYTSELKALRRLRPSGLGLEVGVGTGRFAAPLSTTFGLDPSLPMLRLAQERGIRTVQGTAENLPFKNRVMDYISMITTLSFLNNIDLALQESKRVLKPGGSLIIGMIDEDSAWGKYYRSRVEESPFYRDARFLLVPAVLAALEALSFQIKECVQTLRHPPPHLTETEDPVSGWGSGGFVAFNAALTD
jgi:ubiquinone/menaquinone biosynthesis C-methylase UbiE